MAEKTKYRLGIVAVGVLLALAVLAALPALLRAFLPARETAPAESAAPVPYTLESYAEAHGLSPDDWPEALRELYDKNPDARQFVLEYPEKKDDDPVIDLSGEVTPGEIPALYQWDARWGYRSYNDNLMGLSGCGPTAMSMAIIGLTGNTEADPWTLAQYAEEHGHVERGNGTTWSFFTACGEAYGLRVQVLGLDRNAITAELEQGHVVLVCVGEGDFTDGGHYMLLSGLENGMFRIRDPNSPSNSRQLWTYDRLAGQIRGLWTMRAAE